MFKTSDLVKLGGPPQATIYEWICKGIANPKIKGRLGRGKGTRWNIMQAVGLLIVQRISSSRRGCSMVYAKDIMDAFAGVSERWLREQFHKGHTHFVMVCRGKPLLRAPGYDWVDARAVYDEVTAHSKRQCSLKPVDER